MILTEEQQAALKRVVAYMDEMYAVASPYHGCTEDANRLRAMIDSSGTVEPTGGFDLEAARASISHYRIENTSNVDTESALKELVDQANLAEEYLAEIERLRGEICYSGQCGKMIDAEETICQLYREKDEQAARIKELEADLAQSEICIQARLDVIDQQAAKILKLEAENATLTVLGKKKNWQPHAMPDGTIEGYASFVFLLNDGYQIRKWVSKKGEFPSAFLARILNEKQGSAGMWQEYLLKELDLSKQQAARIAELEKWLKKERSARLLEKSGSILLAYLKENEIDFDKFFDGKALEQLQAEGKIGNHIVGTDQMVPNGKVWQITEERKKLLGFLLSGDFVRDCPCKHCQKALADGLAMLTEAGQCE